MRQVEIANDEALVALTDIDLVMLCNAINETSEALEDWEFQTRTGVKREEMLALGQSLSALLEKMQR